MQYTIQIPVIVTDEDIDNILWTAVNQGSTYWLYDNDIKEQGSNPTLDDDGNPTIFNQLQTGGILTFSYVDDEEYVDKDSVHTHVLTLDLFKIGLRTYLQNYTDIVTDGKIDTLRIDATTADLILQFALFGKQMFG